LSRLAALGMIADVFAKRKILILLACCLAALAAAFFWMHQSDKEPSYEGKSLSEWIARAGLAPDDVEVTNAVVTVTHIGTNAIPCLLHWIRFETPRWYRNLDNFVPDPILGRIGNSLVFHYAKSEAAVMAFSILQTNAAAAIPELTRLMNDTNKPMAAKQAARALASLGKDALPHLLQALTNATPDQLDYLLPAIGSMSYLGTNAAPAIPLIVQIANRTNSNVFGSAIDALGRLKIKPKVVIPVLTGFLASTNNPELFVGAISAVGRFGDQAQSAIPAILPILTNSDPKARSKATNALMQIAPELLTNTPAQ